MASAFILLLEILRAETVCIRALPPVLGTGQRVLSPLPEGGYIGGPLIHFQVVH